MEPILRETIYPAFSWPSLALVVGLIVLGMLLGALEIFLRPGFKAAGFAASLTVGGGCVSAWVFLGPAWGALVVVSSIVASVFLVLAGMRSKALRGRLASQLPRRKQRR